MLTKLLFGGVAVGHPKLLTFLALGLVANLALSSVSAGDDSPLMVLRCTDNVGFQMCYKDGFWLEREEARLKRTRPPAVIDTRYWNAFNRFRGNNS